MSLIAVGAVKGREVWNLLAEPGPGRGLDRLMPIPPSVRYCEGGENPKKKQPADMVAGDPEQVCKAHHGSFADAVFPEK